MKIFPNIEPATLKNLVILFVSGLSFWVSTTCLLPTLPSYIHSLGASNYQVGLVMGCFAIGLLFSRPWIGKLADQHSRKIVLLVGTVVAAVGPVGYILFPAITGLMLVRAFHGISIAAFSTGYSALIVDISPVKQRGEWIGYMSLAIPIGMAVGPAIGGFLETYVNYTTLFMVSAGAGLLAWVLANFVEEPPPQKLTKEELLEQEPQSFWDLLKNPGLNVLTIVLFLIGGLFGTLVVFLPLFVKEIGLDLHAGVFYSTAALSSFAVRIFVGKASDTYGRGLFITLSLLCYAAAMFMLSWGNSPNTFMVAAILEGMGGGVLIPMAIALMSDRSHPWERGKVYAICIGGFDIGVAIAGPILGYIAGLVGYRQVFFIGGSMAIVALIVFFLLSNKNIHNSFRFALGMGKDYYSLDV